MSTLKSLFASIPCRLSAVLGALLLALSFSGCNAGSSGNSTPPPPTPDFTLGVSPASLSVTQGATGGSISLSATAVNGFSGSVAVAFTGLPSGVTASPATVTLTPGKAQYVILTASSQAAVGAATVTLSGTSGSITHTSSIALTVAPGPQPDFAFGFYPDSLVITQGATGASFSILITAISGFSDSVAISLDGLPSGVTSSPTSLTLNPGTPQNVTLTASSQATVGTFTVTISATSGSLVQSAPFKLIVATPPPAATGIDVTTYHYNNARDGLNAQETVLTPKNVKAGTFGLIGNFGLDSKVDAEPLLVSGLTLSGNTMANVLYVATEHGTVYALDATSGTQIWKTYVLGTGEAASDPRNCDQIAPEIGITSTPVIDRSQGPNGTIFVVAMSKDSSGTYHQRLHGLDLVTGAEVSGSPTEITATYPGTGSGSVNGTLTFDPGQYAERVGLLLLNGNIYTAWTSHCDADPYTGWVMAYNETTLKQSSVLNLTPNGSEGAVWMSGFGLAADAANNIYLADANGTFDPGYTPDGFPSQSDYGNAILKLSTAPKLAVADYFEPWNTTAESAIDQDLGAGGAMLLPDLKDASGKTRHLVVVAGKDHNIYLADRDDMGKINLSGSDNSNLYQQLPEALAHGEFGGPAFFNNTLYYGGVKDTIRAYPIVNAMLATAPSSVSAATFGYPGTTPGISANGTKNGIVWALESSPNFPAVLHAYDAADLGTELYNSTQDPDHSGAFGNGNKFITPMIANGRVYIGTENSVAVFGLLNP